jgi:hypothetical protein
MGIDVVDLTVTKPQWIDLRCPVYMLGQGSVPMDPITWGPSGNLKILGAGVNEDGFGSWQLPHEWVEGSIVVPHVHWGPVNANAGNVKWELEYVWQNNHAAHPGSNTTLTVQSASELRAYGAQISSFGNISGAGKTISSLITFRIRRIAASASEYGSDAGLLEVDLHVQVDSLGSDSETSKY